MKLLLLTFLFALPSSVAYADSAVPVKGLKRIPWAVELCGAMPGSMVICLALIALLVVLSLVCAKIIKGAQKSEK